MTGEGLTWLMLAGVTLLVSAPIIYSLLIKLEILAPWVSHEERLLEQDDEQALWEHRIGKFLRIGMLHLGLSTSLIVLKLASASQLSDGLLIGNGMLLALILLVSAFINLGLGTWQVSIGWEKAKDGHIGRSVRKMLQNYNQRADMQKKAARS